MAIVAIIPTDKELEKVLHAFVTAGHIPKCTAERQLKNAVTTVGAFGVHFGGIASGDEDVVDLRRRTACREATSALAVAWEGAGGARACAFSGVPFLEVRSITDRANEIGPKDFHENLGIAMGNLAKVLTIVAGIAV